MAPNKACKDMRRWNICSYDGKNVIFCCIDILRERQDLKDRAYSPDDNNKEKQIKFDYKEHRYDPMLQKYKN